MTSTSKNMWQSAVERGEELAGAQVSTIRFKTLKTGTAIVHNTRRIRIFF